MPATGIVWDWAVAEAWLLHTHWIFHARVAHDSVWPFIYVYRKRAINEIRTSQQTQTKLLPTVTYFSSLQLCVGKDISHDSIHHYSAKKCLHCWQKTNKQQHHAPFNTILVWRVTSNRTENKCMVKVHSKCSTFQVEIYTLCVLMKYNDALSNWNYSRQIIDNRYNSMTPPHSVFRTGPVTAG